MPAAGNPFRIWEGPGLPACLQQLHREACSAADRPCMVLDVAHDLSGASYLSGGNPMHPSTSGYVCSGRVPASEHVYRRQNRPPPRHLGTPPFQHSTRRTSHHSIARTLACWRWASAPLLGDSVGVSGGTNTRHWADSGWRVCLRCCETSTAVCMGNLGGLLQGVRGGGGALARELGVPPGGGERDAPAAFLGGA